jgi:hypothetical protein
MKAFKENISRDINYIINSTTNEGDTSTCRLHMRDVISDRRRQFIRKYSRPQYDMPLFQWQKSFYDHVIRNVKDFLAHYRYTVYNSLKHGLPDDWIYTSFITREDMIDYFEI